MSWQERIEKYKQGQEAERKKVEQGAERKEQEALEAKKPGMLRVVREKVPPLLDVLKQFNCVTLLTQMRDEVWRTGTVSVEPDINKLAYDTPIGARVVLRAEWPVYQPKYFLGSSGEYSDGYFEIIPATIGTHVEELSVQAIYGRIGKDQYNYEEIIFDPSLSLNDIFLRICKKQFIGLIPKADEGGFRYGFSVELIKFIREGSKEETLRFLEEVLIKYCLEKEPEKFVDKKRTEVQDLFVKIENDRSFIGRHRDKLIRIARENGLPFYPPSPGPSLLEKIYEFLDRPHIFR